MGQQNPMKKQMNDLQALGMELTKLSSDTLKKIGLDEELFEAIATYKKNHFQQRAQTPSPIYRPPDARYRPCAHRSLFGQTARRQYGAQCLLQRVEQARIRLLADDGAITQFMADFPQADAGKLRTLIRNTKKEQEQNKPPKNFRALFQEIKAVMEAGQSDAPEEGQDWEE